MTRVLASGVFDIIHPGHVHYLEQARALGDELYVIVASDATAEKKRKPVLDQAARMAVVSALRVVDVVVPGGNGDFIETAESIQPDVIALGWDQKFDEAELEGTLVARGLYARVVRLKPLDGELNASRRIIGRIRNGGE